MYNVIEMTTKENIVNKTNWKYIGCCISLLLAAFVSGLSFVYQKTGMEYVGPFTFNSARAFIGCLSILPLVFISNLINSQKKENIKQLIQGSILAGFILFLAFSVNQYCMLYAPAGKAGFITSLYIIFVPLIAIFMQKKLQFNVQASVILAVIGLYFLCCNNKMQFELSDIFLLLSSLLFALHIITVSYYSKKVSSIKLSCLQFLFMGFFSLPLTFIFETPTLQGLIAGSGPILFIGIVVTGIAYTLQIIGHKKTNPTVAVLILSLEAVFAVLAGMVLLGETMTSREILGCGFMIGAIILSQIPFTKQAEIDNSY